MYRLLLRRPARLLRSHADAAAFQELRCAFPDDRQPVLGRATSRWSRAGPGRDRLIHVRLGPVRQPVEGGGEPAHLRHQEAFFVQCDAETNPPEVRDAGQVVAVIGVAPVKPAEFVVFKLSQTAGGTAIETIGG